MNPPYGDMPNRERSPAFQWRSLAIIALHQMPYSDDFFVEQQEQVIGYFFHDPHTERDFRASES